MVAIEQVTEAVRRWGGENTDAILDPKTEFFSSPSIEGFIGYRDVGKAAVVFGNPVCESNNYLALARAFDQACKSKGKSIVYVFASDDFAKKANKDLCPILIEVGEKLIINPAHNPMDNTGVKGSLVRRKVRHALKEEVLVGEYQPGDLTLENELEELGKLWVESRKGPQVHISDLYLFEYKYGKRWFYARHQGKIVGMLVLNHLQLEEGWLLNHLMTLEQAPSGTPELLVIQTLNQLRSEEVRYLSFGAIARDTLGEVQGIGKMETLFCRLIYQLAKKIFHLEGLQTFWGKFQPQVLPAYLLFNTPRISLTQIKALLKALGTI